MKPRHALRGVRRRGPADVVRCALRIALLAWVSVAAASEVRVGGDSHYPPFHFNNGEGRADGFDVELFRAVAAEAGLQVAFELGDWAQSLQRLERGELDVVPMFVSAERRQRFLFSQAYLRRYHLVFGRRGQPFVADLDQLAGQKVAVQYAGMAWEAISALATPVAIVPVDVEAEAVMAVERGEADYAVLPMTLGYQAIARRQLRSVVALSGPLLEREYAFAVAPQRAELVTAIDHALARVQASGYQDQLYLRWLANLQPAEESYRSGLWRAAWVGAALLAILALWAGTRLLRARRHLAAVSDRAEDESRRRRALEDRAHYLAFHDAVSGLPNRNALEQRLPELLAQHSQFALLRLDLIGLEVIRSVGGPGLSQKIKQQIATRLRQACGSDRVFSVGRGEFALALDADSAALARAAMHRVLARVHERLRIDEFSLEQRCRAGLALFPRDGEDAEALLRAAETACWYAREHCLIDCEYRASMAPDPRNLSLLSDLNEALERSELGYALQPKLDLNSQRLVGAEVLVRWQHPQRGYIPPTEFIPLLEKTGLIGSMTRYLIDRALSHLEDWRLRGIDLSLSVNVSINDLADQSLVDHVIERAAGLAESLCLEVTETDVMRDSTRILAALAQLRRAGIKLSLDDFGTGWSSLTYLRQMAPHELKIDRSFVHQLLESRSDQAIVRATIQLAHHLGASVTAEGIEDQSTLDWLTRAGCDVAQGYFIAQPLAIAQFEALDLPRRSPPQERANAR